MVDGTHTSPISSFYLVDSTGRGELWSNKPTNGYVLDFDLLRWRSRHQPISIDISRPVFLDTRARDAYDSGESTLSFKYHVQAMPLGKTRIFYFSATDREDGGIGWFFDPFPYSISPDDPVDWIDKYVEKREIIIEVLPKDDGRTGSS